MCTSRTRFVSAVGLFLAVSAGLPAVGPISLDGEPAVSIFRDFDDGLFGRSLYRGIVYSVKIGSFKRYRSLPVPTGEGLTAYLVSPGRAAAISRGEIDGIVLAGPTSPNDGGAEVSEALKWIYSWDRYDIDISFTLEKAPPDLFDEILRTYPGNPGVARQVADSYREGYVVRVVRAENVYRPEHSAIDYEDVLLAASFVGDRFQPLWGIHDGNALSNTAE